MENNKIELRNLKAPDVLMVTTIISKLGWREIKNCIKGEDIQKLVQAGETNTEVIGMAVIIDVIGIILENLEQSDQHLYQLLADLSGKTPEEIKDLDADVFVELIIDVITKIVKNKGFLELASRFLNTMK